MIIIIKPLGVTKDVTERVAESIQKFFSLTEVRFPEAGFDALDDDLDIIDSYNVGERLFSCLPWSDEDTVLIGVTAKPLRGEIGGRALVTEWCANQPIRSPAIISKYRTDIDAKNEAHSLERLAKLAIHELVHTFDIRHCSKKDCIMFNSNGDVGTYDRMKDLCEDCQKKLNDKLEQRHEKFGFKYLGEKSW